MFHPVCGAAGPTAGNSHIASHAGKQNGAPGALLPVGIALRAVTLNERRGFCQGIASCQAADGICRCSGNTLCPFRRFGYPILLSIYIGKITFGRIYALRHMGLVKADTAAIQKFLILQPFFHNHPRHSVHERAVRGRTDRNPLRIQTYCRVIPSRIDDNDGNALLFCAQKHIHGDTVKLGFFRVVPPENNQIAV